MNEPVTLTIDGQKIQVPKGTLLIEAARKAGILIPHYCYHPALPVVGSCRMCLVEIEKTPKLQPSCATPVAEGMVVRTKTPQTLQNRRSVLEFLLTNHPLDCPVCDQAGECELQNYYMEHGLYDARFNENKTRRKKATPIGPYIILDQERCILCTRCVRFTREVSKTGELGVIHRGHRSEIDIMPGFELVNRYSGNLGDICPVGALTDRDFRFKCRVWFLGSAPSVCPGCSRGCNIEIHFNERFNPRYHEQRVHRLKPRYNAEVNGYWICDEGRYAYHAIDAPERLRTPRMKRGGDFNDVSWAEALQEVSRTLKGVLSTRGPKAVAVIASPQMTNEELFLARQIFVDQLGVGHVESTAPSKIDAYADDFLMMADKNPNTMGAGLIFPPGEGLDALLRKCDEGQIEFLYIFHQDLAQAFERDRLAKALSGVRYIVFDGPWNQATAALADIQLPAAVYAEKEGTFTNFQGRVQKIHPAVDPLGESMPDLEILGRLAFELGLSLPASGAPEVFDRIGSSVPAFSGLTWESIGPSGRLLQR